MDKRKIFVPALFLLAVSGASAWEEANPNAVRRMDGKEIKVEKALQGVYLSTELLQCFSNSVSLDMGYFREDRLASTFTLRTMAGLYHSVYWAHWGVDQFGQEYISYKENPKKPYYGLSLGVETAPPLVLQLSPPLQERPAHHAQQWLVRGRADTSGLVFA